MDGKANELTRKETQSFIGNLSALVRVLSLRTTGPGGLYNVGNVIALVGGISIQWMAVEETVSIGAIIAQYLFGSPEASLLSLAVLIFLVSGEVYHRAWSHRGETALRMVRIGDGLSGVAAVVLTFALVQVGEAWLGLIGGVMLIVGKFGTAFLPERPNSSQFSARTTKLLRLTVVASRGPSLAALLIAILSAFASGALKGLAMPILMVVCYLIWLWADILLMRISPPPKTDTKEPCPLDFMP